MSLTKVYLWSHFLALDLGEGRFYDCEWDADLMM